uniref:Uncharacterized protein n=1 Tax=Anguilla anguilla TaxID=7936 RepID=A0A0E9PMY6_ANGAN
MFPVSCLFPSAAITGPAVSSSLHESCFGPFYQPLSASGLQPECS